MGLFSDCHQYYSSAEQLTDSDADALGNNYTLQFDSYCLLDVIFTYRCCYHQVSVCIPLKFSRGYSTSENALFGRSCCNMGEDLEHWLWLSWRTGR